MGALFLYWSFSWPPDLYTRILLVQEKEPRCVLLRELKALHSHKTWAEVSSSAPHLLHEGLLVSPIKYKYLLMVLCPIWRPKTTLDGVLLKDNSLIFTVGLRPEISYRDSLRVLITPSFQSSLRPSPPHRAPKESTLHLSSIFYLLSNFPVKEPSTRFPNRVPMERKARFQSLFYTSLGAPEKKSLQLNKISPFSKSPVKETPSIFPQQGPYGERYSVTRANDLFLQSFIHISKSPHLRSFPTKWGENTVTIYRTTRGRKAYMQWSGARFHKGIVYDTAVTTSVPCSLQHDTFHLGLGRLVSQRVS